MGSNYDLPWFKSAKGDLSARIVRITEKGLGMLAKLEQNGELRPKEWAEPDPTRRSNRG